MPRRLRSLVLTVHVASTVGWLGTVLVFVVLALVGSTSREPATVRGVLIAMEPVAWWVLLPLAAVSLVVGVVQAVGTQWGLIRHWWVVFKLVITAVWTGLLVVYMPTFGDITRTATDVGPSLDAMRPLANSVLLHGGVALFGLIASVVLSVYKPRATTPYRSREPDGHPVTADPPAR